LEDILYHCQSSAHTDKPDYTFIAREGFEFKTSLLKIVQIPEPASSNILNHNEPSIKCSCSEWVELCSYSRSCLNGIN